MSEKPKKLSTEPYKGVRDFYPADMAVQEYIFGVWKKTAESFGYEEYGASVLEPAELYRAKSGEEIVNEQTYTFIDRGEREVTLRPEMTPTVARMVAAKRKEFNLPLRWYSIPNLFRYEQPQRGRLREHWQLNVDMFGSENLEADVEIISLAYQVMKNFGAKDGDFEIKLGSKTDLLYTLAKHNILPASHKEIVRLIDRKGKMPEKERLAELKKLGVDFEITESPYIKQLREFLTKKEIKNVIFDPNIVRGFEYYTGMVFEVYDTSSENRRSLFGGGRYDDLTSLFGGDKIPAVGFGMGDVTIRDFLETHKLLSVSQIPADCYVCVLSEKEMSYATKIAEEIRAKGLRVSVDLSYKKLGDQVSYANKRGIPFVVIVGANEAKAGKITLKNMKTGDQKEVSVEEAIKDIKK